MATLDTTGSLTLMELAKQRDPKGNAAIIAEVLNEENPFLQHAPYIEANGDTYHKILRRLNLPSGTWRKLNEGVAAEASQTDEFTETLGMLYSYLKLDADLIKLAPSPEAFIMNQAKAFLEGLGQTFADTMVYGNATIDTEKFTGLAPRLNSLSQNNVESAGGSGGDTTSIYIVQWGEAKAYLIYPRGHKAHGVERSSSGGGLGYTTLQDASGKDYPGYKEEYSLKVGLAVEDERCIARYCNIEATGSTNTFDEDPLIRLTNKFKGGKKNMHIYCNDTIYSQMQIKLKDKGNINFTHGSGDGLSGAPIVHFNGIPVSVCDAILNNETEVS
jgi:hypothetical protein